ncbi:hypothetical protein HMPREF1173_00566 [Prevotella nigrescens CC14M]|uniref:Uncharacterized protein n=1 Tax=Prevotella nigrescens CC14M TaxID=1073366 RepID=V8CQS5_9BACT|nr:hypothetical protein HMPREF1173_00566 [Prevotella nigrescens CC14M]
MRSWKWSASQQNKLLKRSAQGTNIVKTLFLSFEGRQRNSHSVYLIFIKTRKLSAFVFFLFIRNDIAEKYLKGLSAVSFTIQI